MNNDDKKSYDFYHRNYRIHLTAVKRGLFKNTVIFTLLIVVFVFVLIQIIQAYSQNNKYLYHIIILSMGSLFFLRQIVKNLINLNRIRKIYKNPFKNTKQTASIIPKLLSSFYRSSSSKKALEVYDRVQNPLLPVVEELFGKDKTTGYEYIQLAYSNLRKMKKIRDKY